MARGKALTQIHQLQDKAYDLAMKSQRNKRQFIELCRVYRELDDQKEVHRGPINRLRAKLMIERAQRQQNNPPATMAIDVVSPVPPPSDVPVPPATLPSTNADSPAPNTTSTQAIAPASADTPTSDLSLPPLP